LYVIGVKVCTMYTATVVLYLLIILRHFLVVVVGLRGEFHVQVNFLWYYIDVILLYYHKKQGQIAQHQQVIIAK
jgi:hypothetical protein